MRNWRRAAAGRVGSGMRALLTRAKGEWSVAAARRRGDIVGVRRLSRDDVVLAAVELTAAHGLSELTVRALATRLGVRSPSIYHHLPGGLQELRTAVVEKIADLVANEVGDNPTDSIWEWVTKVPLRVGAVSRRYPGVLQYLLTTGRDERLTHVEAEHVAELLLKSELRHVAAEAYVLIQAFVAGWACAQLPSRSRAQELGFESLAGLLAATGDVGNEVVLVNGLRALLVGMKLDGARDTAAAASGSA